MGTDAIEIIAPMVVAIVLFVTVGGVILLKPIANKLGHLLEAMAHERANPPQVDAQLDRMTDLLETMNARLSLLEERQDFTDALLADPERQRARLKRAGELPEEREG